MVSLGRIIGGKIRFDPKYSTDQIDIEILRIINGGIDGTIELSKKVKMAPKNLLNRLKKYQRLELIELSKIKQKPKGWKRHYKLTLKGKEWIKSSDEFQKSMTELSLKFKESATKQNEKGIIL